MKSFVNTIIVSVLTLVLAASIVSAQVNKNVEWKLLTPIVQGVQGKTTTIKIEATIKERSHIYSGKTYAKDVLGPSPTIVTVGEKNLLTLAGPFRGNRPPNVIIDANFDSIKTEFWEGSVVLTVPVKISRTAAVGTGNGWVNVHFMSCDDHACMPPTDVKLPFSVEVVADTSTKASQDSAIAAERKREVADSVKALIAQRASDSQIVAKHPADTSGKAATGNITTTVKGSNDSDLTKARKKGLWPFLLLCMAAGFGSIFMPCVYPIIPITVSFFTKRNHATHAHAMKDAFFYAVGIVLTFTVVGVPATLIFGPEALGSFIQHPVVSICIAALFITLAKSVRLVRNSTSGQLGERS